MASWTFLTTHGLMPTCICRHPDSTGLEIAQAVVITERTARKIGADLLTEGYVDRKRFGRRNSYRLDARLFPRHPAERTAAAGKLLGFRIAVARGEPAGSVPDQDANDGARRRPGNP